MKNQDYQALIQVNADAETAFNAICNVSKWWTENFEGRAENTGDMFTVRFGDAYVTARVLDAAPPKGISWLVTDCYLPWLQDRTEWTGTIVHFTCSRVQNTTQLQMTHIGLSPGVECYASCVKGWDQYFKGSLSGLIAEGKGDPQKRSVGKNG